MIKKCSSCNSELESGSLIDFTQGAGLIQRYAKVKDFPTGIKKVLGIYEADFKEMRRVHASRCLSCNQIFLFAQDEVISADLKKSYSKFLSLLVPILIVIIVVVILLSI